MIYLQVVLYFMFFISALLMASVMVPRLKDDEFNNILVKILVFSFFGISVQQVFLIVDLIKGF